MQIPETNSVKLIENSKVKVECECSHDSSDHFQDSTVFETDLENDTTEVDCKVVLKNEDQTMTILCSNYSTSTEKSPSPLSSSSSCTQSSKCSIADTQQSDNSPETQPPKPGIINKRILPCTSPSRSPHCGKSKPDENSHLKRKGHLSFQTKTCQTHECKEDKLMTRDIMRGINHGSLSYDKTVYRIGFDQHFKDRYENSSGYRYSGRNRYRGFNHWNNPMNYFNSYNSYGSTKNGYPGMNSRGFRGSGGRYRGRNYSANSRGAKGHASRKQTLMTPPLSPNPPRPESNPGVRSKNCRYNSDSFQEGLLDVKITVDKLDDSSFTNCDLLFDSDFAGPETLENLDLRTIHWHKEDGVLSNPEDGYVVHFHINPGTSVTFTTTNGDIQRVSGPATVRMVSTNSSPPIPLPVQMPPGHIVQQIVDETGTLQHVILSTQPMPMPVCPYMDMNQQSNDPMEEELILNNESGEKIIIKKRGEVVSCTVLGTPRNQGPHQYYNPPVSPHPTQGFIPGYQTPHQYSPVMSPSLAQTTSPPPHNYKHDRNLRHPDKSRNKYPRHGHGSNQNFNNQQYQKAPCNSTPPLSPQKDNAKISDQANENEAPEGHAILKQLLSDVQAMEVSEVTPYSAILQWKPPDISTCPPEVLGKGIIRYDVFLANHFQSSCTTPQFALSNLLPGTEYKVHFVCSCNSIRGKPSPFKLFYTKPTKPDPPQPPRLIEKSKNSLFFRWYNTKDNGAKITHYSIEILGGDYAEWTEIYRNRNKQFSIQKLKPQTAYKIRLAAINEIGRSLYSAEISETTSGLSPSQPQPPSLKQATVNTLTLSWEKRPIDDSFTLQMEDPFTEYGFRPVYNGKDLSYMCTELERNADYKFRLRSQNIEGSSPFSNIVSYTTLPDKPMPPSAPTIKGKVLSDRLTVAWSVPLDQGGSTVERYQLEVDKGKGFELAYNGCGMEYDLRDLVPGKSYKTRCLAESQGGKSAWSQEALLTTKSVVPNQCLPPKPLGKPKATTLQLKWAAPDFDGGEPITEFHLDMMSPSSERKQVYCGRDHECMVASLLPGRTYIFLLRAVNKVGQGPWSEPAQIVSGAGPPDAPKAPSLTCKNSQTVVACWDEPINNGACVRQYSIQYADVTSEEDDSSDLSDVEYNTMNTGTNTAAEIHSLSPATSYVVRIAATNVSGRSPWSPVSTIVTPSAVPDAVNQITSKCECYAINLQWKEPCSNGESILHYDIEVADRIISTQSPVLSYQVTDLEAETMYKIRIRAVNSVGCGAFGSYHKTCTSDLPPKPPKIELMKASYNALRLKWGDGKNYSLLNYTLEMECLNSKKSMEFLQIYSGTNQNYKVVKLDENTTYKFRLCVSNEAGVGPYSEPHEFSTTRAPPQAPKAPRVTENQSGTYCVEWYPLRCSADEKMTYKLQMMHVGKVKEYMQIYSGPELSLILTDLVPENGYYVRVCGIRTCSDGDVMVGAYSPPVYFFTPKATVADTQPVVAHSRKEPGFQWKKLSDQEKAFGMVLLVSVIAFLAAYLVSLAAQNSS